jgi:hypothetical protein
MLSYDEQINLVNRALVTMNDQQRRVVLEDFMGV